jgi:hypothetical protein
MFWKVMVAVGAVWVGTTTGPIDWPAEAVAGPD